MSSSKFNSAQKQQMQHIPEVSDDSQSFEQNGKSSKKQKKGADKVRLMANDKKKTEYNAQTVYNELINIDVNNQSKKKQIGEQQLNTSQNCSDIADEFEYEFDPNYGKMLSSNRKQIEDKNLLGFDLKNENAN